MYASMRPCRAYNKGFSPSPKRSPGVCLRQDREARCSVPRGAELLTSRGDQTNFSMVAIIRMIQRGFSFHARRVG